MSRNLIDEAIEHLQRFKRQGAVVEDIEIKSGTRPRKEGDKVPMWVGEKVPDGSFTMKIIAIPTK